MRRARRDAGRTLACAPRFASVAGVVLLATLAAVPFSSEAAPASALRFGLELQRIEPSIATHEATVTEVATGRRVWEGWVAHPSPSPDGTRLLFRDFTPEHGPVDGHLSWWLLDLSTDGIPARVQSDDDGCHDFPGLAAWRPDSGAVAIVDHPAGCAFGWQLGERLGTAVIVIPLAAGVSVVVHAVDAGDGVTRAPIVDALRLAADGSVEVDLRARRPATVRFPPAKP